MAYLVFKELTDTLCYVTTGFLNTNNVTHYFLHVLCQVTLVQSIEILLIRISGSDQDSSPDKQLL